MLRKSTATAVRKVVPEAKDFLAHHMTHSTRTQDKYYAIYNQREMAMPVVKLIADVMENQSTTFQISKSIHWPKQASDEEMSDEQGNRDSDTDIYHEREQCLRKEETLVEKDEKQTLAEKDKEGSTEGITSTDDKEQFGKEITYVETEDSSFDHHEKEYVANSQVFVNLGHERRSFHQDESNLLLEICEGHKQSGVMVVRMLLDTISKHPRCPKLLLDLEERFGKKEVPKKVVDRVRAEYRRRKRHH